MTNILCSEQTYIIFVKYICLIKKKTNNNKTWPGEQTYITFVKYICLMKKKKKQ